MTKSSEIVIYSMIQYMATFHGRHMELDASYSEVQSAKGTVFI